jgi:hypothetical protein
MSGEAVPPAYVRLDVGGVRYTTLWSGTGFVAGALPSLEPNQPLTV